MPRILAAATLFALVSGCIGNGGTSGPGASNDTPTFALRGRTNQGALRIHTFTRVGGDHDACVSSDGQWLAFSSSRHAKNPQLYLKKLGAQTVIRRTFDDYSNIQPKFSPDGTQIAYASDASGNWDIWIARRDSGPGINLTDDMPGDEIHPTWHPTRPILAFSSYDPASAEWYVCVKSRRSGGLQILTPGLFPEWSPDGRHITFQRARQRGVRWYSIWMVDVEVDAQDNIDCSQPAEIVASDRWAAINPAWSPDSRYIVFATVYKSATARAEGRTFRGDDIWMVGIDGRDLVRLTTTDAADWDPFWAPEPEGGPGRIYFTSLMGGHSNIWSLRPVIVPRIDGEGVLSNKESKADTEKSIIMENLKAQRETGAEKDAKVGLGTQIGLPGGTD